MRPATISFFLFVVSAQAANAQLRVIPQIGLENSRATLFVNDLRTALSPANQLAPQAGLRMDYQFKKNHGPYLAATTSRSDVSVGFSNPEMLTSSRTVTVGNTQVRLEAGYQWTSKPIFLGKKSNVKSSSSSFRKPNAVQYSNGLRSYRCGGYKAMKSSAPALSSVKSKKDNGVFVSVVPSIGAAYIPGNNSSLAVTKQGIDNSYIYSAGNYNTALLAGAGLAFGKNQQQRFIISMQYVRAIGNGGTTNIVSESAVKENITSIRSQASGWNLKAGIPINLTKKKQEVKQVVLPEPAKPAYEKKCQSYRRCGKTVI